MQRRAGTSFASIWWLTLVVSCTPTGGESLPSGDFAGMETSANGGLPDPGLGGQSGGEGGNTGGGICGHTEHPFESARVTDGEPLAADVARAFAQRISKPMVVDWLDATRPMALPPSRLQLSDFRFGEVAQIGCGHFSVATNFHLQTDDGALDADFAGTLDSAGDPDDASGSLSGALVGRDQSNDTVVASADERATVNLTLRADFAEGVVGDLRTAGRHLAHLNVSPEWWQPKVTRQIDSERLPLPAREPCKLVKPTSAALFPSDAALISALSGQWILCSGQSPFDVNFAGIEIDSSGQYHELVTTDGQLVARYGFDHQGLILRRIPAETIGSFLKWQEKYGLEYLGLSADGTTLQIRGSEDFGSSIDATFQAASLPVSSPTAFADAARAGLVGCTKGEGGLQPRSASVDDLRTRLIGRWMFCRGRLGIGQSKYAGIAFFEDGGFHWLNRDGQRLNTEVGAFDIVEDSGLRVKLRARSGQWELLDPEFSRGPVKVRVHDTYETVFSAF